MGTFQTKLEALSLVTGLAQFLSVVSAAFSSLRFYITFLLI